MTGNTLISPDVVEVLDRLFTEAEASETALEALAQSEASHLITSKSGYRQFYGLMKDIPLPVSRETGSLLYMLTRSTRAQSILEFGTSFGVSTIYLAATAAAGLSPQNSSLRRWRGHANTSRRPGSWTL
jgi:predicted O-methyltransferase YrrM